MGVTQVADANPVAVVEAAVLNTANQQSPSAEPNTSFGDNLAASSAVAGLPILGPPTVESLIDAPLDVPPAVDPTTTDSPMVSTSPSYAPAIFAEAAQYQLVTQSGLLSALLHQGLGHEAVSPFHRHPEDIQAIEGGSSSSMVDTQA